MKRTTKESLATAFQIVAIGFLFGDSFSSSKVAEVPNAVGSAREQVAYSNRLEHQIDSINAINLYYEEKRIPGLLYTRLNIAVNFMVPSSIAGNNTGHSSEYEKKITP